MKKILLVIFVFSLLLISGANVVAQHSNNTLSAFSSSSLILGEWKLIGIHNDYHSSYLSGKSKVVEDESRLLLNFSKTEMVKRKGEEESVFTYRVIEDTLTSHLFLSKDEVEYKYVIVNINHFSLTISSEVEISTGLDHTTEVVYYTYLRVENEVSNVKDVLGTWSMCSDKVIQDFTSSSNLIYRFHKNSSLECDGVSKIELEINHSSFQLLQNVRLENEKSYKFISSNLLVNLEKNLIYFKLSTGLVFDIITLTDEVLEIRLNKDLTEKIQ